MAQTQNWELQLAALVNTSDLLNFFEPENGILAGIKLKTTQQTQAHRTKFGATDSAVTLTAEVLHRDRAVRKNTKEAVEIFSYPMDASGAKRCMREAVLLKRAAMAADQNSPSIRRGLRHLIAPIGIWTTQETSFLHVRSRFFSINTAPTSL